MSGKYRAALSYQLNLSDRGDFWSWCAVCSLLMFSTGAWAQSSAERDISEELSEARAMCAEMTAHEKALAAATGYDIEKLCKTLGKMHDEGGSLTASEALVVPRNTTNLNGDIVDRDRDRSLSMWRCGFWQNRSRYARCLYRGIQRQTGGYFGPHYIACSSAPAEFPG